jgi:hypothetical protein
MWKLKECFDKMNHNPLKEAFINEIHDKLQAII